MSARRTAGGLAGAGLALAVCGLAGGALSSFAASPVALGLALLARNVARTPGPESPRRVVGAGLGGIGVAGVLVLVGAPGWSLVALGVAIGVLASGARLALELDPPLDDPQGGATHEATRPGLWASVALDESVMLAWEMRGLLRSRVEVARIADEVRMAADRNHRVGWIAHPEHAHLAPPPLEKSNLVPRPVRTARHLEQLCFPSEYEPLDPEIRDDYLSVERNRRAVVYLCRHPSGPRPTLLLVHGYGMGHPALDLRVWDGAWLHEALGLDLALFVLPLHGARARSALSGRGFFDRHPLWTSAALGQAVWDLRRVSGWLRGCGAPALGVAGLSLGGTVASLFASVESNLACVVSQLPVASLESLLWQCLPPHARADARSAGLSEQLLGEAWARNAPLRMRPRVPHEARLLVGARADRIVPPAQVQTLWEHWGRPAIHWQPGTHLVWGDRAGLRERLAKHLCDTLIAAGNG